MPEPQIKRGTQIKPRSRNKDGTWRKKRSDAGIPRETWKKRFVEELEAQTDSRRPIEFPKDEPENWYAEYGVDDNMLEVCLGIHVIRLPQELIMGWFMSREYNALNRKRDGEKDEKT